MQVGKKEKEKELKICRTYELTRMMDTVHTDQAFIQPRHGVLQKPAAVQVGTSESTLDLLGP
jgi:hypothetical protein